MNKIPERFKKIIENRNLNVINEEEYTGCKNKMSFIDKEGYMYYCTLDVLRDKRTKNPAIVGRNNIYTMQNIQKFIENHGYKTKVISKDFNGLHGDIICQCECGNIYRTEWNHINQMGKFTCTKCGIKRIAKAHLHSKEYINSICEEHGFKMIAKDYIDSRHVAIMDKDGYKYLTVLNYIKKDKKFNSVKFCNSNPYTIENMVHYIKINNIPCNLVDETNRKIKVRNERLLFYCSDCGNPFEATWTQITEGRYRCKDCVSFMSNLEYRVKEYLDEKNIQYVQQKKFKNCKNKNPLPFDFYLPFYNAVIEVMGLQHYKQSKMFKQSIEERKRIDKLKKDFCLNNGIKYLEIPCWAIDNKWKIKRYKILIDNLTNT